MSISDKNEDLSPTTILTEETKHLKQDRSSKIHPGKQQRKLIVHRQKQKRNSVVERVITDTLSRPSERPSTIGGYNIENSLTDKNGDRLVTFAQNYSLNEEESS